MSGNDKESMWHIICHECGEHWNLLTATVCPHCFAWPKRTLEDKSDEISVSPKAEKE